MTHAETVALDCRIVALRRDGAPCKVIAELLGVTVNRVSHGLRRRGATGLPSTVRRPQVPGRTRRPPREERRLAFGAEVCRYFQHAAIHGDMWPEAADVVRIMDEEGV